MKHIFFAFPGGLAGAALLLLRVSVALLLVTIPAESSSKSLSALFCYLVAITIGLGFCARIAAAVAVAICAILLWPPGPDYVAPFFIHILDAVALALIGPGAFSIDARLFGRRTVHLPD
jgi:hypothetical protein